jgi:hypothetical protein
MDLIEPLILNEEKSVGAFNIHAILAICTALGLDTTKIRCSSELQPSGTSNELLIALIKKVGGAAYLCGGGASGYQQDELYAAAGITLRYQNYVQPHYPQHLPTGNFVPGLSVVDAMMNIGLAGTRELLVADNKKEQAKI